MITVFSSVFQGEKFIDGYLENLEEQTIFPNIECIFIHAKSSSDKYTLARLETFSKKHKNVKYIKLENDPGLYACWNKAVRMSQTEWITNWNIDDRKFNFSLELFGNILLKNKNLDIIYGYTFVSEIANEKYIDNDFSKIYPCLPHSLKNLLINNSPHCMPMWRKDLHDRFGYFDENYKSASDGDMWLKACVNGANIKMINHPVGLYYNNPTGKSTQKDTLKEMVEEVRIMREKYIKFL